MLQLINYGGTHPPGYPRYLRYNFWMAWAIITIYTSKCAQMDLQQLLKTSTFYSRCKKCDIEKTVGGVGTTPLLVARRLITECCKCVLALMLKCLHCYCRVTYTRFYRPCSSVTRGVWSIEISNLKIFLSTAREPSSLPILVLPEPFAYQSVSTHMRFVHSTRSVAYWIVLW